MKETQKNTIYQTPKVTVVAFKVEGGFQTSPGPRTMNGGIELQQVNQGNDISNTSTLTRWE